VEEVLGFFLERQVELLAGHAAQINSFHGR
jgi:hypothetical protein